MLETHTEKATPFEILVELNRRLGAVYGSEDLSILLYSLIKMQKPRNIVELGTGLGVSALWMSSAAKENGCGMVWTVDDGRQWRERGRSDEVLAALSGDPRFSRARDKKADLLEYMTGLSDLLGIRDHLRCLNQSIVLEDPDSFEPAAYPFLQDPIDLLFADIAHGPVAVLSILGVFLPFMAASASIFIDSASTYLPSYLVLEETVDQLNRGKIPARLIAACRKEQCATLRELVAFRRFVLVHLVEAKQRAQNSTAWLKIEPVDIVPYPQTAIRI